METPVSPVLQFSFVALNVLFLISTLLMCKKKFKPSTTIPNNGPLLAAAAAPAFTIPITAEVCGDLMKSPKADSFAARKPEIRVAKRNDEIVQQGPVSKKRGDYKTMNITSINFDDSLTEQGLNDTRK